MFPQVLATAIVLVLAAQRGTNNRLPSSDKTFFLQQSAVQPNLEHKLVIVVWSDQDTSNEGRDIEACDVVHDQVEIQKILSKENNPQVELSSKEQIEKIQEQCPLNSARRKRQMIPNPIDIFKNNQNNPDDEGSFKIGVIWPGTKWCGAGNIAKNYDDLGLNADTDKCCRAHDRCPDIMASGETKYNLTNNSLFTSLNCQCDQDFHDCLTRIDSVISNSIGFTYFNALGRQCYQFDYPIIKCKRKGFLGIPCLEFEFDRTAKTWNWVKAEWYNTFPLPGPLTIPIPV